MAIIAEKPIGSQHPVNDPEWVEAREALAKKAIDLKFTPRKLSRELEDLATNGDPLALMLMRRLHRYGVTKGLLNDIDASVHNVCVFAVPEIDYKTKKFTWRYGFDVAPRGWLTLPHIFQSAYEMFCFVLMRLIDAGIEKVVRCEAPAPKDHAYQKTSRKCENYYFARSNKNWCSSRCGVRVSTRGSEV